MSRAERGGGVVPALCNLAGTLMLLAVILCSIPLAVPRWMGYQTYRVVSGSMAPAIPVGSVIYVKAVEPEQVQAGDVVAYWLEDAVVAHRVTENHVVEGELVTKGDANQEEDFATVPYASLIGRVERHIPMLGELLILYASPVGKGYILIFAACGAMFHLLAGRLRRRRREEQAIARWKQEHAQRP